MKAEIIGVGTELLLGNIANTDAKDISLRLSELGIDVYWHTVVGDNPGRLMDCVNTARGRADLIITTGGLGPTCDDLTKQTLAKAFGLELYFDEEEAAGIRRWFQKNRPDRPMTENNMQQAWLPEGCTVFHNDWGTAPGCAFYRDGVRVAMLPGPPRECLAMMEHRVMPYLREFSDGRLFTHNLRVFGEGESSVEARLRDLMNSLSNPTLAPYAKEGECLLRVTAKAADEAEAERMMAPVIEKVKAALGDTIYGVDADSMEERVLTLLGERRLTLAVAESCTGGLIAKRLTDIPGASRSFLGGVTVYTDGAKAKLLGVDPGLIREKGAVSAEVAAALAISVREALGADLGLGVTGLAGPSGDGVHEIGTVFAALAAPEGVYLRALMGGRNRERVRISAANHCFDMARRYLTGLPVEEYGFHNKS